MFEGMILNHRVANFYVRLLYTEAKETLWVCEMYSPQEYITIGRLHINELQANFNLKNNG